MRDFDTNDIPRSALTDKDYALLYEDFRLRCEKSGKKVLQTEQQQQQQPQNASRDEKNEQGSGDSKEDPSFAELACQHILDRAALQSLLASAQADAAAALKSGAETTSTSQVSPERLYDDVTALLEETEEEDDTDEAVRIIVKRFITDRWLDSDGSSKAPKKTDKSNNYASWLREPPLATFPSAVLSAVDLFFEENPEFMRDDLDYGENSDDDDLDDDSGECSRCPHCQKKNRSLKDPPSSPLNPAAPSAQAIDLTGSDNTKDVNREDPQKQISPGSSNPAPRAKPNIARNNPYMNKKSKQSNAQEPSDPSKTSRPTSSSSRHDDVQVVDPAQPSSSHSTGQFSYTAIDSASVDNAASSSSSINAATNSGVPHAAPVSRVENPPLKQPKRTARSDVPPGYSFSTQQTHHYQQNSQQGWDDHMYAPSNVAASNRPAASVSQNPFQTAREYFHASGGGASNNRQPPETQHTYPSPYQQPNSQSYNPYASAPSSSHSNPPPPAPVIRDSLKRKFQPPKRVENASNGASSAKPTKKGSGLIHRNAPGKSQQGPSNSGCTSSKDNKQGGETDDDDLPEELQRFGKDLVEKIESEIMDGSGDSVTFDDIAGLADAKQTIQEVICWPMKRPDLFTGLRRAPNALLLYGPPGTGKTLIGKAIAHESGATFFSISSSSLTSKWIGEGEKLVRTMFAVAAYRQPSVVFIDEIDSLLTQRKADENEASRRIKTEFLVQMDGTGTTGQGQVLTIGATNRPQELDEAARRRFVKRLYIPLPEEEDRLVLLRVLLQKNTHKLSEADMSKLAVETRGFSGADLKALCTDAAMGPLRSLGSKALQVHLDQVPPIAYKHFRQSLRGMKPSVAPGDLVQYEEWDKIYGSKRAAVGTEEDDDDDDEDS